MGETFDPTSRGFVELDKEEKGYLAVKSYDKGMGACDNLEIRHPSTLFDSFFFCTIYPLYFLVSNTPQIGCIAQTPICTRNDRKVSDVSF